MLLERREQVVPQRCLLGGLDLRQVEYDGCARVAQAPVIVDHIEREIDDRSGEAGAVLLAHVAIIEVQTAHAEDLGSEIELLAPVGDYRSPEKALRPLVHPGVDFFGDAQATWVFSDRELEVAPVVERHGIDLPEGVLSIEHPAVSAREQSISDVAQGALGARPSPSARRGA